jgi:hypothetical protein
MITQQEVKELFNDYDGILFWKVQKGSRGKINTPSGVIQKRGYYAVNIDGKKYYNHRLIFLYHHGYLPKFIDHIDGDKGNNKIENLRPTTPLQNIQNSKGNSNASSKYKGLHWRNDVKMWRVRFTSKGKRYEVGYFKNEIDAALSYNKKVKEIVGEYAYLNNMD